VHLSIDRLEHTHGRERPLSSTIAPEETLTWTQSITLFFTALAVVTSGCSESFQIRSYPLGARALVDGKVVGSTPTEVIVPRPQAGLVHKWRVEFRNCDYAEGEAHPGIAPGRVIAYILTAGIFAAIRGPYYYNDVDAVLTGGDCEGRPATAAPAQPGIMIQNIVGDKNQTGTAQEISKTQRLSERLTTLRDLYNRKLISEEVYEREMKKAVDDSR